MATNIAKTKLAQATIRSTRSFENAINDFYAFVKKWDSLDTIIQTTDKFDEKGLTTDGVAEMTGTEIIALVTTIKNVITAWEKGDNTNYNKIHNVAS